MSQTDAASQPIPASEKPLPASPGTASGDALPDPEPEVPSLSEPDPGVFHPDATQPEDV